MKTEKEHITGRLILALDVADCDYALELVDAFGDQVHLFKVGFELFLAGGPAIVTAITRKGKEVFLDLKFHDIPNTVAQAGVAAARMGVFMFNVHASGGLEMMKRCADEVVQVCLRENIRRPKMLGVTVLTSMSSDVLRNEIGIQYGMRTQVRHLAALSLKAGLDGVVASGHEVEVVRNHCGNKFMLVTPGIRPSWTAPDDQKRTMTPREALRVGANYLVMGRSILKQKDPIKALELIQREIDSF